MSFFKKLKEEFGGSSGGEAYPAQGGYPQGQYPPQDQYNRPPMPSQHSSYGQQPPYGQHQQPAYGSRDAYGQQPSYGQQPPAGYGGSPAPYGGSPAPYGERPPPQSGYGSPAPPVPYGARPGEYGGSPAPYGGSDRPPVPGQWVPLFSEQHQRWYFVETTGRSLWDAPTYVPPQAPMPAYGDYAGSRGAGGDFAPPSGPPPGGDYRGYGDEQQKPKEDHDKRNMMLAAGGALAVGAVGGAILAEALGLSCPSMPAKAFDADITQMTTMSIALHLRRLRWESSLPLNLLQECL